MNEAQSGFMSNQYAYDPLAEKNGIWKDALGTIGGAFAGAVATSTGAGVLASTAMATAGTYAGKEIGVAIDNAQTISNNVQTFVSEINDWRSWASAMQQYGGAWISW